MNSGSDINFIKEVKLLFLIPFLEQTLWECRQLAMFKKVKTALFLVRHKSMGHPSLPKLITVLTRIFIVSIILVLCYFCMQASNKFGCVRRAALAQETRSEIQLQSKLCFLLLHTDIVSRRDTCDIGKVFLAVWQTTISVPLKWHIRCQMGRSYEACTTCICIRVDLCHYN